MRSRLALAVAALVWGVGGCSDPTGPGILGRDWILFTGQSAFEPGHPEVYAIRPDGSGLRVVTGGLGQALYPRWSRDGSEIAYATIGPTGNFQSWVMQANGSGARVLATPDNCSFEMLSSWSPSGDRIVVDCYVDQTIVDVRSATNYSLTQVWGRSASTPDWSPSGEKLLYVNGADVHVANLDGTGDETLLLSASEPAWSPDGLRIAFVRRTAERSRGLFVANADGSNEHQLTFPPDLFVFDETPSWSPDGSRIVFVHEDDTNRASWALHVIDANGARDMTITPDTLLSTHPDW
jgi:Tol biopolymer transport system component